MHLKDLLGSFVRVGYHNTVSGFLSSATWPSLPKKHYNGLNQTNQIIERRFSTFIDVDIKVRGPFVETFCIEKDSYMDAISRVNTFK